MSLPRLLPSIATLGLVIFAGGSHAAGRTGDWMPTSAQIEALEANLPRQPPSGLLASSRYYYGLTSNRHRFIVGEILGFPGRQGPGIYLQRDLPIVNDGGCSVINLTYDVAKRAFIAFGCNGQA